VLSLPSLLAAALAPPPPASDEGGKKKSKKAAPRSEMGVRVTKALGKAGMASLAPQLPATLLAEVLRCFVAVPLPRPSQLAVDAIRAVTAANRADEVKAPFGGWVLAGFPETAEQAEALESALNDHYQGASPNLLLPRSAFFL
jgi:hypothetical protein